MIAVNQTLLLIGDSEQCCTNDHLHISQSTWYSTPIIKVFKCVRTTMILFTGPWCVTPLRRVCGFDTCNPLFLSMSLYYQWKRVCHRRMRCPSSYSASFTLYKTGSPDAFGGVNRDSSGLVCAARGRHAQYAKPPGSGCTLQESLRFRHVAFAFYPTVGRIAHSRIRKLRSSPALPKYWMRAGAGGSEV